MSRRLRPWLILVISCVPAESSTAQTIFRDGFEPSCFNDSDGDRLPDCEEGVLGTSYTIPDTDGDGIADGDEVLGTIAGLNLPAMGVSPLRKDVLVEMDWADDAFECFAPHSHRPSPLAVEGVRAVFSQMPISNPDGSTGINFIADFGQGGAFDGGNFIVIPNGIVPRPDQPEFAPYKAANFNTNREGYFRYSIHAHRWDIGQDSSGYADIVGDNSVVTLHCHFSRRDYVRNTIIHELGHNFGLRHGGDIDCNEMPNYNSVMNYQHQFFGLDETCDTFGDHVNLVNYSTGTRIPLNEFALNETHGVCGPSDPNVVPIDWNNNGIIEANVNHDIRCPGLSVLMDHDDFAALILPPASAPGGGAPPMDASNACPSPPTE